MKYTITVTRTSVYEADVPGVDDAIRYVLTHDDYEVVFEGERWEVTSK